MNFLVKLSLSSIIILYRDVEKFEFPGNRNLPCPLNDLIYRSLFASFYRSEKFFRPASHWPDRTGSNSATIETSQTREIMMETTIETGGSVEDA
jgi:hypothetical protein